MVLSSLTRVGLLVLLSMMSCSRHKLPEAVAQPEVWLAFSDPQRGNISFPIEQISAEWVGREFSLAIASSDGRMLQIQQLKTDSLPGFYEGGTFRLVYMSGNFQSPCISQQPKKNSLEIVKTENGYLLNLKGVFDCPDFKYTVTGALPISEPERPNRTTYPIAR